MPAISVLIKPSSSICNMNCKYCFYCDESQKRQIESYGFMDEKTLKNVIRKTVLQANIGISFAFQGGEPTLRGIDFYKKAMEYEKQYNKNHLIIHNSIQTNGLLINEEWCHFLKENQFLVGLSVDGTQKIHDSLRKTKSGEGTFEKICDAAKLMKKHGVEFNILTVVTSEIADHVVDIYLEYKKRGWKYQQYIACLDPLGEGHQKSEFALTPQKYGQFLINLFYLWNRDRKKSKHPYIRQFENWVMLKNGYLAEACDQSGICSIQNVVEADGSVYPCDFYVLDEYCLGNFNKNSLDEIDMQRQKIKFIEKSLQLDTKCTECKYYKVCRGGCHRNRDYCENTKRYENYFCNAYKMFFDECFDLL